MFLFVVFLIKNKKEDGQEPKRQIIPLQTVGCSSQTDTQLFQPLKLTLLTRKPKRQNKETCSSKPKLPKALRHIPGHKI